MGGKSCSVYGCGNYASKRTTSSILFHTITGDDERYPVWVEACGRPELSTNPDKKKKYLIICSLHFEKFFYKSIKFLHCFAIPTLNLPPKPSITEGTQTDETRLIAGASQHNVEVQTEAINSVSKGVNVEMDKRKVYRIVKKSSKRAKIDCDGDPLSLIKAANDLAWENYMNESDSE